MKQDHFVTAPKPKALSNLLRRVKEEVTALPRNALTAVKGIDRWVIATSLACFVAPFFFNGSPLEKLGDSGPLVFISSQVFSLAAMALSQQSRLVPNMSGKLKMLSAAGAVSALQFLPLALGGIHAAWTGVLMSGLGCARSATFAYMPDVRNDGKPDKKRIAVAAGFAITGTAFMFTGFGLVNPLVDPQTFIKGNWDAIGTSLPMMASLFGTAASAMTRTRLSRPFYTTGGVFNCLYNVGFSGSFGHMIGELGAMSMMVRQALSQDTPPKNYLGQKLSPLTRLRGYLWNMRNTSLPEEHFKEKQTAFETDPRSIKLDSFMPPSVPQKTATNG